MPISRSLIAFAALAATAVASADTQVVDFFATPNGGLVKTNWVNGAPASSNALMDTLRFSPSLGTLTGVSIDLKWQGSVGGSFTNKSGEANSYTADYTLGFKLMSGGVLIDPSYSFTAIDATFTGSNIAVGAPTVNFTPAVASGSKSFAISDAALMNSLFVGSGKIGLQVRAEGLGTMTANGPKQSSINTYAGAWGKLTYTYAPQAVPEPASMAALGLGALGLLRRRKGGAK